MTLLPFFQVSHQQSDTLIWLMFGISIPVLVMYLSQTFLALSSTTVIGALAAYTYPNVSINLQSILEKEYQPPLYQYPTSLTQGIVPVRELSLSPPVSLSNSRIERYPLSQRLLASCTCLHCHLRWVRKHRSRPVASQWVAAAGRP